MAAQDTTHKTIDRRATEVQTLVFLFVEFCELVQQLRGLNLNEDVSFRQGKQLIVARFPEIRELPRERALEIINEKLSVDSWWEESQLLENFWKELNEP